MNKESSPSPNKGRVKGPPIWMRDYESDEGPSKEDNKSNMTLFTTTFDPFYFDEVMKSAK